MRARVAGRRLWRFRVTWTWVDIRQRVQSLRGLGRAASSAVLSHAKHLGAYSRSRSDAVAAALRRCKRPSYNVEGRDGILFPVEFGDPAPSGRFIAVGRFVDKKAPHRTLPVFRQVVEQCPDAVLIMGGTGSLWSARHDLVRFSA